MQQTIRRVTHQILRYYVPGLARMAKREQPFLLASAMAFSLLMCLIPFVLVIFAVVGVILQSTTVEHQLYFWIDATIPNPESARFVKELLSARVGNFIAHKTVIGGIGLAGLFIAASGWLTIMRTALNRIFCVREIPPSFKGKLKDFGVIWLLIAYFVLTVAVPPVLEFLRYFAGVLSRDIGIRIEFINVALLRGAYLLLIYFFFFILFYFIPDEKIHWRIISVSAAWASAAFLLAQQFFGYYFYISSTLGEIYGTYVIIVVIAIWLYYSSLTLLFAAMLGQLYRVRTATTGREQPCI